MPTEYHGAISNASGDIFREEGKPASVVYNAVGTSLQQYCTARESQYLDTMRSVWGMIDLGAQAMNVHIQKTW